MSFRASYRDERAADDRVEDSRLQSSAFLRSPHLHEVLSKTATSASFRWRAFP